MIKKTLKFKIIVLLTILVLISSFFWKHYLNVKIENNDLSKDIEIEETQDKIIVDVWLEKDSTVQTREYQIEKFNQNNEKVYINFNVYDQDYDNLLKITTSLDNGPDIMTYGTYDLIRENDLLYLNDLDIDAKKNNKDTSAYYNGNIIGTRINEDNVKLIWNKDLFEKAGLNPDNPPKTWKELISYSEKIKEYDNTIAPFAFPITNYNEFKISIGEPSVNLSDIYTNFWNYNKGNFEFEFADNILNIYNSLYTEDMLPEDFYKKTRDNLRTDFSMGKIAMMISSYEDKVYFKNIIPFSVDLGVADIPKFNIKDSDNYYYISNDNFICINNSYLEKGEKEKKAILEVYNFLISSDTNNELNKLSLIVSPLVEYESGKDWFLTGYDKVENFTNEILDPAIYMSRDSVKTIELCVDAILGEKTIEESIDELNLIYKNAYDLTDKYNNLDFDYYIMNSENEEK